MSIRFLKLSLASPQSIRSWTERTLPNGKRVGKILKGDLIDYKNGLPIRDGLSCERIFGPMVSFTCTCGRFKCIETRGIHIVHDTLRSSRPILPDASRQTSTKQWDESISPFQISSTNLEMETPINPIQNLKPIKKRIYNQKSSKPLKRGEFTKSSIFKSVAYRQKKMIRFLESFYYDYESHFKGSSNTFKRFQNQMVPSFVFEKPDNLVLATKNVLKSKLVHSKKRQLFKKSYFFSSNKKILKFITSSSKLLEILYEKRFQIYGGFWFDLKVDYKNFIYEKHVFLWVPNGKLKCKKVCFRVDPLFYKTVQIRGLSNKSQTIISGIKPCQIGFLHLPNLKYQIFNFFNFPGFFVISGFFARRIRSYAFFQKSLTKMYTGWSQLKKPIELPAVFQFFMKLKKPKKEPQLSEYLQIITLYFAVGSPPSKNLGILTQAKIKGETWLLGLTSLNQKLRSSRRIKRHWERRREYGCLEIGLFAKQNLSTKNVSNEKALLIHQPMVLKHRESGKITNIKINSFKISSFDLSNSFPKLSSVLKKWNPNSKSMRKLFGANHKLSKPLSIFKNQECIKRTWLTSNHQAALPLSDPEGGGLEEKKNLLSSSWSESPQIVQTFSVWPSNKFEGPPKNQVSLGLGNSNQHEDTSKTYAGSNSKQNIRVYKFKNFPPEEIRYCPYCEVELLPNSIRRYRLGYIEFVSPVTHIWYTANSIPLLLNLSKTLIERIASCHEALSSGFPPVYKWSYNGESPTSWTFQTQPLKLPVNKIPKFLGPSTSQWFGDFNETKSNRISYQTLPIAYVKTKPWTKNQRSKAFVQVDTFRILPRELAWENNFTTYEKRLKWPTEPLNKRTRGNQKEIMKKVNLERYHVLFPSKPTSSKPSKLPPDSLSSMGAFWDSSSWNPQAPQKKVPFWYTPKSFNMKFENSDLNTNHFWFCNQKTGKKTLKKFKNGYSQLSPWQNVSDQFKCLWMFEYHSRKFLPKKSWFVPVSNQIIPLVTNDFETLLGKNPSKNRNTEREPVKNERRELYPYRRNIRLFEDDLSINFNPEKEAHYSLLNQKKRLKVFLFKQLLKYKDLLLFSRKFKTDQSKIITNLSYSSSILNFLNASFLDTKKQNFPIIPWFIPYQRNKHSFFVNTKNERSPIFAYTKTRVLKRFMNYPIRLSISNEIWQRFLFLNQVPKKVDSQYDPFTATEDEKKREWLRLEGFFDDLSNQKFSNKTQAPSDTSLQTKQWGGIQEDSLDKKHIKALNETEEKNETGYDSFDNWSLPLVLPFLGKNPDNIEFKSNYSNYEHFHIDPLRFIVNLFTTQHVWGYNNLDSFQNSVWPSNKFEGPPNKFETNETRQWPVPARNGQWPRSNFKMFIDQKPYLWNNQKNTYQRQEAMGLDQINTNTSFKKDVLTKRMEPDSQQNLQKKLDFIKNPDSLNKSEWDFSPYIVDPQNLFWPSLKDFYTLNQKPFSAFLPVSSYFSHRATCDSLKNELDQRKHNWNQKNYENSFRKLGRNTYYFKLEQMARSENGFLKNLFYRNRFHKTSVFKTGFWVFPFISPSIFSCDGYGKKIEPKPENQLPKKIQFLFGFHLNLYDFNIFKPKSVYLFWPFLYQNKFSQKESGIFVKKNLKKSLWPLKSNIQTSSFPAQILVSLPVTGEIHPKFNDFDKALFENFKYIHHKPSLSSKKLLKKIPFSTFFMRQKSKIIDSISIPIWPYLNKNHFRQSNWFPFFGQLKISQNFQLSVLKTPNLHVWKTKQTVLNSKILKQPTISFFGTKQFDFMHAFFRPVLSFEPMNSKGSNYKWQKKEPVLEFCPKFDNLNQIHNLRWKCKKQLLRLIGISVSIIYDCIISPSYFLNKSRSLLETQRFENETLEILCKEKCLKEWTPNQSFPAVYSGQTPLRRGTHLCLSPSGSGSPTISKVTPCWNPNNLNKPTATREPGFWPKTYLKTNDKRLIWKFLGYLFHQNRKTSPQFPDEGAFKIMIHFNFEPSYKHVLFKGIGNTTNLNKTYNTILNNLNHKSSFKTLLLLKQVMKDPKTISISAKAREASRKMNSLSLLGFETTQIEFFGSLNIYAKRRFSEIWHYTGHGLKNVLPLPVNSLTGGEIKNLKNPSFNVEISNSLQQKHFYTSLINGAFPVNKMNKAHTIEKKRNRNSLKTNDNFSSLKFTLKNKRSISMFSNEGWNSNRFKNKNVFKRISLSTETLERKKILQLNWKKTNSQTPKTIGTFYSKAIKSIISDSFFYFSASVCFSFLFGPLNEFRGTTKHTDASVLNSKLLYFPPGSRINRGGHNTEAQNASIEGKEPGGNLEVLGGYRVDPEETRCASVLAPMSRPLGLYRKVLILPWKKLQSTCKKNLKGEKKPAFLGFRSSYSFNRSRLTKLIIEPFPSGRVDFKHILRKRQQNMLCFAYARETIQNKKPTPNSRMSFRSVNTFESELKHLNKIKSLSSKINCFSYFNYGPIAFLKTTFLSLVGYEWLISKNQKKKIVPKIPYRQVDIRVPKQICKKPTIKNLKVINNKISKHSVQINFQTLMEAPSKPISKYGRRGHIFVKPTRTGKTNKIDHQFKNSGSYFKTSQTALSEAIGWDQKHPFSHREETSSLSTSNESFSKMSRVSVDEKPKNQAWTSNTNYYACISQITSWGSDHGSWILFLKYIRANIYKGDQLLPSEFNKISFQMMPRTGGIMLQQLLSQLSLIPKTKASNQNFETKHRLGTKQKGVSEIDTWPNSIANQNGAMFKSINQNNGPEKRNEDFIIKERTSPEFYYNSSFFSWGPPCYPKNNVEPNRDAQAIINFKENSQATLNNCLSKDKFWINYKTFSILDGLVFFKKHLQKMIRMDLNSSLSLIKKPLKNRLNTNSFLIDQNRQKKLTDQTINFFSSNLTKFNLELFSFRLLTVSRFSKLKYSTSYFNKDTLYAYKIKKPVSHKRFKQIYQLNLSKSDHNWYRLNNLFSYSQTTMNPNAGLEVDQDKESWCLEGTNSSITASPKPESFFHLNHLTPCYIPLANRKQGISNDIRILRLIYALIVSFKLEFLPLKNAKEDTNDFWSASAFSISGLCSPTISPAAPGYKRNKMYKAMGWTDPLASKSINNYPMDQTKGNSSYIYYDISYNKNNDLKPESGYSKSSILELSGQNAPKHGFGIHGYGPKGRKQRSSSPTISPVAPYERWDPLMISNKSNFTPYFFSQNLSWFSSDSIKSKNITRQKLSGPKPWFKSPFLWSNSSSIQQNNLTNGISKSNYQLSTIRNQNYFANFYFSKQKTKIYNLLISPLKISTSQFLNCGFPITPFDFVELPLNDNSVWPSNQLEGPPKKEIPNQNTARKLELPSLKTKKWFYTKPVNHLISNIMSDQHSISNYSFNKNQNQVKKESVGYFKNFQAPVSKSRKRLHTKGGTQNLESRLTYVVPLTGVLNRDTAKEPVNLETYQGQIQSQALFIKLKEIGNYNVLIKKKDTIFKTLIVKMNSSLRPLLFERYKSQAFSTRQTDSSKTKPKKNLNSKDFQSVILSNSCYSILNWSFNLGFRSQYLILDKKKQAGKLKEKKFKGPSNSLGNLLEGPKKAKDFILPIFVSDAAPTLYGKGGTQKNWNKPVYPYDSHFFGGPSNFFEGQTEKFQTTLEFLKIWLFLNSSHASHLHGFNNIYNQIHATLVPSKLTLFDTHQMKEYCNKNFFFKILQFYEYRKNFLLKKIFKQRVSWTQSSIGKLYTSNTAQELIMKPILNQNQGTSKSLKSSGLEVCFKTYALLKRSINGFYYHDLELAIKYEFKPFGPQIQPSDWKNKWPLVFSETSLKSFRPEIFDLRNNIIKTIGETPIKNQTRFRLLTVPQIFDFKNQLEGKDPNNPLTVFPKNQIPIRGRKPVNILGPLFFSSPIKSSPIKIAFPVFKSIPLNAAVFSRSRKHGYFPFWGTYSIFDYGFKKSSGIGLNIENFYGPIFNFRKFEFNDNLKHKTTNHELINSFDEKETYSETFLNSNRPLSWKYTFGEENLKVSSSYKALLRKAKILEDYPAPDPYPLDSKSTCLKLLNAGLPRPFWWNFQPTNFSLFGPRINSRDHHKNKNTETNWETSKNFIRQSYRAVSPFIWDGNQNKFKNLNNSEENRLTNSSKLDQIKTNRFSRRDWTKFENQSMAKLNDGQKQQNDSQNTGFGQKIKPKHPEESGSFSPVGDRDSFLKRKRLPSHLIENSKSSTRSFNYERNLRKLRLQYLRNFRRLRFIEYLKATYIKPEWMILSLLPVLPPDLRPVIANPRGYITGDINTHYQNVIYRNNNIEKLLDTFWIPRKFYSKISFANHQKNTVLMLSSIKSYFHSVHYFSKFKKEFIKLKNLYPVSKLFSQLASFALTFKSENEIQNIKVPENNNHLLIDFSQIYSLTETRKPINKSVRILQSLKSTKPWPGALLPSRLFTLNTKSPLLDWKLERLISPMFCKLSIPDQKENTNVNSTFFSSIGGFSLHHKLTYYHDQPWLGKSFKKAFPKETKQFHHWHRSEMMKEQELESKMEKGTVPSKIQNIPKAILLNNEPWQQDFIENKNFIYKTHQRFSPLSFKSGGSIPTVDGKILKDINKWFINEDFKEFKIKNQDTVKESADKLMSYNIDYKPLVKLYNYKSFFGSNLGMATGYNKILQALKFKALNDQSILDPISRFSNSVPSLETKLIRTQALHDSKPLQEMQYSLQKAVDALIDNSQKLQSNVLLRKGRPLKSLSDNLKGKEGRFRQHLLGKRVDYSGRSVIVVGPELKLYECGIPLIMALRLFQPFLILYLIYRFKIASLLATQLIQRKHPMVINLLKKFIETWPILLNRAPTLHRMNIQAFKIRLVQGKAILLHPLVCSSYNADFDGDQMGVHVPITQQARAESWKLLWSINNSIGLASRQPLFLPSQDMVIGNYYLTAPPIENGLISFMPKRQTALTLNFKEKSSGFSNFNKIFHRWLLPSFSNESTFSLPEHREDSSFQKINHYFFNLKEAYQYYLNTTYHFHVNTPVWFRFNMVFETSEREKSIEITIDKHGNSIYITKYYEKQLKRNRILGKNVFNFINDLAFPITKPIFKEKNSARFLSESTRLFRSLKHRAAKESVQKDGYLDMKVLKPKIWKNSIEKPITNKKLHFFNNIDMDKPMVLPPETILNRNLSPIILNQIIRSTFGRIEFYYEVFYASR